MYFSHEPPRVTAFVQPSSAFATPVNFLRSTSLKHLEEPNSNKHNINLKPLPPTTLLVEPFGPGGFQSPFVLTPATEGADTSNASSFVTKTNLDQPGKPTCSLNLVCYSRGCSMSQIRVTLREKFDKEDDYQRTLANVPSLITTDHQLFRELREHYLKRICGTWRSHLSLKTLRRLRLLEYTEDTRPCPVPMDDFTMQEVLYAYDHPSEFGTETDWIEWVFRLREPDKRHALEFVEGWNGSRIAIVGTVPCIASTLVGVIWSARGGDVQTAFTVAGFILTTATVLLALLAVVSGIDSRSH